jgi:hypothetical protein
VVEDLVKLAVAYDAAVDIKFLADFVVPLFGRPTTQVLVGHCDMKAKVLTELKHLQSL